MLAPPAVTMLAVTKRYEVVMTRQWIYTLGCDHWRLPSGAVDPQDTDAAEAAHRELADETGLRASTWTHLGRVHEAIDVTNRAVDVFLAMGLTQGAANLEGGEADLTHKLIPFTKAIAWVENGWITHGPSAYAVLRVAQQMHRDASP
ncbi:NUDIX domain-containing protein [Actinokineospora sp. 24-640]